jgi:hypothetical protein
MYNLVCGICNKPFESEIDFPFCSIKCTLKIGGLRQQLAPIGWDMLQRVKDGVYLFEIEDALGDNQDRTNYLPILINCGLVELKITERGARELNMRIKV